MDSDCSRTAPGHCCGSTQHFQHLQVSKRLPTAARNDVRASERTLASIRSTMTENRLVALLLLRRHREHCLTKDGVLSALLRKPDDSTSFFSWNGLNCSGERRRLMCRLSSFVFVFVRPQRSKSLSQLLRPSLTVLRTICDQIRYRTPNIHAVKL